MLVVILTLLCAAASPSRGVTLVNHEEHRPSRFNRGISLLNDTAASATSVATRSLDIPLAVSSAVTSPEPYRSPVDVASTLAASSSGDAYAIAPSTEDNDASSEAYTWWTIFNLGTITTIRRPTLVLPTATSTRDIPRPTSQPATMELERHPVVAYIHDGFSSVKDRSRIDFRRAERMPDGIWTDHRHYHLLFRHLHIHYDLVWGPSRLYAAISAHQHSGRSWISGKTCTIIHPTATDGSGPPHTVAGTQTIIMVTTDKNPAVVFPSEPPPSYGGPPSNQNGHDPAPEDGSVITTPQYGMLPSDAESVKSSPTPTGNSSEGPTPITVIVQPTEVVVNDRTFTDNPTQRTSTVVVGSDTFVIDPSRVMGGGATITRPPPNIGAVFVPITITTSIGGLGVVYGPSAVTIDGTVFTIRSTPTSAVIQGQTITLGPEGIIFPTQTLRAGAGPAPTQTAVMGGELIAAIGRDRVVIEGTTISYGPGFSSTITTVVDGDTILITPTGIIVHNEILGGVAAMPAATAYEIVGGATVTQLGLNALEIGGKTYHIGLGAPVMTTVVNGQTLTIGPKGVAMSTWTLGSPYASTTTLMPGAGNNVAMIIPTATQSAENGGPITRPDWTRVFSILYMAIGAGCLGQILLQL
ncbi:hypothetical protein GGS23DRAFT_592208 [Durotheca rogersii]|uniref:uncharacterized protein n=1 Tax=Durotheca rogersii TaxID=419775 RepID=UPI0022201BA5|nr:uncharacterized protein GGS23DRAFT_592208 [Durotheca rogersii]KAI5868433.1 hypothetical protein GGS23DRAFT_592208 [Durotheca rogersii]